MSGANTDLTQTLVSLLPVLVGGLLTTLGALVGPPLVHWLNEKSRRRQTREEKFEELIEVLYEHAHWLDEMKNVRVFGDEDRRRPSPLPKARAIVTVYFPVFSDYLSKVELAGTAYEWWMFQRAEKRLAKDGTKLDEGFENAYAPYLDEFTALIAALQEWAKREFRR